MKQVRSLLFLLAMAALLLAACGGTAATPTASPTGTPVTATAIPTDVPVGTPVATNFPVDETDVNFIMAKEDVQIYNGPGESYESKGFIAGGQAALVTGLSPDKNWWRVICPDSTIGDCWVTADPAFTEPTEAVGP